MAWICLDGDDIGAIGYQKFEHLMYRLKPDYSDFEIGVLFKLLDPDGNQLIDVADFSVMMINLLYLSIAMKPRSKEDELKQYLEKLDESCPYGIQLLKFFTSDPWRYFVLVVCRICLHSEERT